MVEPVHITKAQAAVAHLVGQGYSNPQIAGILQLSESTVKNHLNSIYKQGGVVNRNELVAACKTGRLGTHVAGR
jgi:DNA-binding CsgD family transcriptional regulator